MRLIKIKEIKGKIILKSGLHIGAGDTEMHIGGTDNPVIKHPITQEPYIPGSSLKGKVRSLLEMESGLIALTKGEPLQARHLKDLEGNQKEKGLKIIKLFGSSGSDSDAVAEQNIGPTRVSFADCPLNDEWKEDSDNRRNMFEVKSENSINRIKGTAESPRFTERVAAGAEFDFSVSLKLMGEGEQDLFDYLLGGLKLLQMDALGGSGSRGYGRIEFQFEDSAISSTFQSIKPFSEQGDEI